MTYMELYWAAMYVSEIWYGGHKEEKNHPHFRLYCRARAVVLFDRVINGRVKVEAA